jgi:predicted GIY-YIG superfamily endonuclease
MIYIYYLHKGDDIPFYVGKTKDKKSRLYHHKNKFKNKNVVLEIIDEVFDQEWKFWEKHYISLFRSWGFKLENKNDGGGGPSFYTEEQKQKMRKPRPGSGVKISKTLRENNHSKYYTDEIKQKISQKLKGKTKIFTKEHKNNLAKANLISKGKTVECYDLQDNFIQEFSCLREAKEFLLTINPLISTNVDKQIKDCCNGRQKTCHNFKFKYKQ